jgi:endogenous inhibitor of DNA gyrase (YacG/DUF329 family)
MPIWDVRKEVKCTMCGKKAPRTAREDYAFRQLVDVADLTGWASLIFPIPKEPPAYDVVQFEEAHLCPKCGKRAAEFVRGL